MAKHVSNVTQLKTLFFRIQQINVFAQLSLTNTKIINAFYAQTILVSVCPACLMTNSYNVSYV
jgi:hypothetical protein